MGSPQSSRTRLCGMRSTHARRNLRWPHPIPNVARCSATSPRRDADPGAQRPDDGRRQVIPGQRGSCRRPGSSAAGRGPDEAPGRIAASAGLERGLCAAPPRHPHIDDYESLIRLGHGSALMKSFWWQSPAGVLVRQMCRGSCRSPWLRAALEASPLPSHRCARPGMPPGSQTAACLPGHGRRMIVWTSGSVAE